MQEDSAGFLLDCDLGDLDGVVFLLGWVRDLHDAAKLRIALALQLFTQPAHHLIVFADFVHLEGREVQESAQLHGHCEHACFSNQYSQYLEQVNDYCTTITSLLLLFICPVTGACNQFICPVTGACIYSVVSQSICISDINKKMNQNVLTTFSIIALTHQLPGKNKFYLTNQSFARDNVFLNNELSEKDYENCLFYVETDGAGREFKLTIEFGQKVVFRHKLSNKYLRHSDEFEEQENDTTYKLKLSHQKHYFKIYPCFQYQTKISNKIRFNEQIHLVTEISGAKIGYLSSKSTSSQHLRKTIIGINQHSSTDSSKFIFHSYYEFEKEETSYTYGSIIWLSHIQSSTFMSSKIIDNKKQLVFEHIEYQKDLQSVNGLWIIESDNMGEGGKLLFDHKFRLKNLAHGHYMAFSKSYKMNENQKIFNIILEENPSKQSYFMFKSLNGEENHIKKGSYLIFKHAQSSYFIGARTNILFQDTELMKPISNYEFSDEDLFKIIELSENEEEAIRFVLSIRQELDQIQHYLSKQLSVEKMGENLEIFESIKQELEKLKHYDKLFQKVQGEMQEYIEKFCGIIHKYRSKISMKDSEHCLIQIVDSLKIIYQILVVICSQNRNNQQESFKYMQCYVEDIFYDVGAENIIIETCRNNHKILCQVPYRHPSLNNQNIVSASLNIIRKFSKKKDSLYWKKMYKFIELLKTLIQNAGLPIDINQRLVSEEFFRNDLFTQIFFGIKVVNSRIKVEEEPKKFVELERIGNQDIIKVIEEVFKLFSMLCCSRNFISKEYIHNFLNPVGKNSIEVLIAYLSMPISEKLIDNIYSLITNLYIDSSPRIERQRPLQAINFTLSAQNEQPSEITNEEADMSERLHSTLLSKAQEMYRSMPSQISNILVLGAYQKFSLEPTVNHDELNLYKQELFAKINKHSISLELLKSIKTLICLESCTITEILQINNMLREKLKLKNLTESVIIGIMNILQEIYIYTQEIEIRKMTEYLKHKFRQQSTTIYYEREFQYLLPFPKRMNEIKNPNNNRVNAEIRKYNHEAEILEKLHPNEAIKDILFHLLTESSSKNSHEYIEKIYGCYMKFNFINTNFLKLIMNSIVLTNSDFPVFEKLFDYYKKIKHLVVISEYWLFSVKDGKDNFKNFIKYLIEVTNFLHEEYNGSPNIETLEVKQNNNYTGLLIKEQQVYVNRQLLIRNIGFHQLPLQILENNYYLLQSSQAMKEIGHPVFSLCFQFIFGFIYNCQENKQIIHRSWSILDKFQNLPQIGQTHVYRELYKDKIEYIREIKKKFIQRIVEKIIKSPKTKTTQNCQFDPQYLQYLETIIKVNGVTYKPNLEKMYRIIQKDTIFRKIVFGRSDVNGKVELCLQLYQIKTDPIQVPYIYHIKILGIFYDMYQNLELQSAIIGSKIRNMFNLSYLLRILCKFDIYTHDCIEAKMSFLLKQQVMKIVSIFIERVESINVLHNSDDLMNLLLFFEKIFIKRISAEPVDKALNEALYVPFIKEYYREIDYYENNQRIYYLSEVKPFLQKLLMVFVKSKKNQSNPICDKIVYILENTQSETLKQNYNYRKYRTMDKIKFKWLNFVDQDVDNGQDEKFAKLSVVDLLRNKAIKKQIVIEKKKFYNKEIVKSKIRFLEIMLQLIEKCVNMEFSEHECEAIFTNIRQYLIDFNSLLDSIETKGQKAKLVDFLLEKSIFGILLGFTNRIEFDFSKVITRNVFEEILKVLTFMTANSEQNKANKELYRLLNENKLSYRFLSHLKETIMLVSAKSHQESYIEQINDCLDNLSLIVEERKGEMYKDAVVLMQRLCEYEPFAKFLRYQPGYPSVDFLEVIYHCFKYAMFPDDKSIVITITSTDITENLLRTISMMMIGGNEMNQNYLIDNKYPQIITEVLKKQNLVNVRDKTILAERERELEEVIAFYERNGIDISQDIRRSIKIKDFSHSYLLSRIKFLSLDTLLQCVTSNEKSLNKIKFQIPVELLKINLIWVYEDYVQGKKEFEEKEIFKKLESWEEVIDEENLNDLFLMTGFILYYLIQNNEELIINENEEQDAIFDEKEKNKQKIVKKFFKTIAEKDRVEEKVKKLHQEPFAKDMKLFFEKYYESLQFFKSKTLTIEVKFGENLTRIFFPKIPLCEKLSANMIQEFKQGAIRISQEEKLKSLIMFEDEAYDFLQGEEEFFSMFQHVRLIQKFLRLLNQDFLRLWALIMCFIQTILFFIENFQSPSFQFAIHVSELSQVTVIFVIIFAIGIANIFIGFLMLFYLVFKKMPILIRVVSEREIKREISEREVFLNGRYLYIVKSVLPQFIFSLIYFLLLISSFFNSLFAGFILFDIMNRLELGRQIVRSVKETWFQLLAATILLVVINYLYAVYVYVQFTQFYSPACQYLFQCLLLLLDQSLKSDSGFLGSTPIDYEKNVFDLKFFSEMIYIIFAQKVIFEIFSGTIIDKFSELREQNEAMREDENSNCYICGQERFKIDFELEGFEEHVRVNHNPENYLFYLFYLRRKNPENYGIVERYVSECQKKKKKIWIPDEISILKLEKMKLQEQEEEENQTQQFKEYMLKKLKQAKKIRSKGNQALVELKATMVKSA